jgi:DNA-binding LytR/AlgR family response regulator
VRVLVVDDEPIARRRLCRMLEEIGDVEIVGEASDGLETIARVSELRPDLVLLDIRMPRLDGLTLARTHAELPPIIFTTAYDQHAVEAFDACAVDYLLKPIKRERLERALARARLSRGDDARVMKLLGNLLEKKTAADTRVLTRDGDTVRVFDAGEVVRFYAADKYSAFLSAGREHLLEESLNTLEERLTAHDFIRTHRAELVSLKHITSFHAERNGGWVELSDGQRARVSRRHVPALRRALRLD